jgi:ArsR family transcriptional regulator
MDYKKYESASEVIKAMAHPMRLCILAGLKERPHSSVTCMQECLGVPQSTLSQQLAILRRAGLIIAERKGKIVEYKLENTKIKQIVEILTSEGLV